jgi:hypothetical protein
MKRSHLFFKKLALSQSTHYVLARAHQKAYWMHMTTPTRE